MANHRSPDQWKRLPLFTTQAFPVVVVLAVVLVPIGVMLWAIAAAASPPVDAPPPPPAVAAPTLTPPGPGADPAAAFLADLDAARIPLRPGDRPVAVAVAGYTCIAAHGTREPAGTVRGLLPDLTAAQTVVFVEAAGRYCAVVARRVG